MTATSKSAPKIKPGINAMVMVSARVTGQGRSQTNLPKKGWEMPRAQHAGQSQCNDDCCRHSEMEATGANDKASFSNNVKQLTNLMAPYPCGIKPKKLISQ